jgi:hypothetical protein
MTVTKRDGGMIRALRASSTRCGHMGVSSEADTDGLTYNGVIAVADQTGGALKTQYYSRRTYPQVLAERLRLPRLAEQTAPHFPPSPDYSR